MAGGAGGGESVHHSWLLVLRGLTDAHHLRTRRLLELEAFGWNRLIQTDLRDLQIELVVIVRTVDPDRPRKGSCAQHLGGGALAGSVVNRLPVGQANIRKQKPLRPESLQTRDQQVRAVKPNFP